MFNMLYNIFYLIYYTILLVMMIVRLTWNILLLFTFLQGLYLLMLRSHELCQYLTRWKKEELESCRESYVEETSFNISVHEDDIRPEDSVSSKYSDESTFENVDSLQVTYSRIKSFSPYPDFSRNHRMKMDS